MSCPCFRPRQPRSSCASPQAALLPLGDSWTGDCLAQPDSPVDARELHLSLCNLGYARGVCPRFPAALADAVRFALHSDQNGTLQIYYVVEQAHLPLDYGTLTYRSDQGSLSPGPASPLLREQALAYAASYLRRKSLAPPAE